MHRVRVGVCGRCRPGPGMVRTSRAVDVRRAARVPRRAPRAGPGWIPRQGSGSQEARKVALRISATWSTRPIKASRRIASRPREPRMPARPRHASGATSRARADPARSTSAVASNEHRDRSRRLLRCPGFRRRADGSLDYGAGPSPTASGFAARRRGHQRPAPSSASSRACREIARVIGLTIAEQHRRCDVRGSPRSRSASVCATCLAVAERVIGLGLASGPRSASASSLVEIVGAATGSPTGATASTTGSSRRHHLATAGRSNDDCSRAIGGRRSRRQLRARLPCRRSRATATCASPSGA